MKTLVLTGDATAWNGLSIRGVPADIRDAWGAGNEIMTAAAAFGDYDVFVLSGIPVESRRAVGAVDARPWIEKRVEAGGYLIAFADRMPFPASLPGNPQMVPPGSDVVFVEDDDPLCRTLKRFESQFHYSMHWPSGPEALVENKFDMAVAAYFANRLILPSLTGDRRNVVQTVIERHPEVFEVAADGLASMEPPAWVEDIEPWGRLQTRRAERQAAESEFANARDALDHAQDLILEEERWTGLLWGKDDDHLKKLVGDALRNLGVPVQDGPPGLQDLQLRTGEYSLMIEVTGSKNDIGLRKGQQLGQWVTDEEISLVEQGLAIPIVGVIIGNAFCETDPAARTAEHFGANLKTYARRRAFKLITTREIFQLITNAGVTESTTVRSLLGIDTFAN